MSDQQTIEALTKELSELNATLAKLEEKIKEKKQLKKKFKVRNFINVHSMLFID